MKSLLPFRNKSLTFGLIAVTIRVMVQESNVVVNSSKDSIHQNLARITGKQAREFLTELANLGDEHAAAERFETLFERFQRMSGSGLQTFSVDIIRDRTNDAPLTGEGTIDLRRRDLYTVRDELRSIWATRDLKLKEWRIFLFHADPGIGVDTLSAIVPPPPNAFHQAVMYLFKWAGKTRVCRNPECSSPYFLARKKNQKYCSEDCALPAQRACKRDWWRKHGDEWRRKKKRVRHKNSTAPREGIPKTAKPNAPPYFQKRG